MNKLSCQSRLVLDAGLSLDMRIAKLKREDKEIVNFKSRKLC